MDEQRYDIEDLEVTGQQAEDVKGGFHWGADAAPTDTQQRAINFTRGPRENPIFMRTHGGGGGAG